MLCSKLKSFVWASILGFVSFASFVPSAQAKVWTATQTWSTEWEQKYGDWINQEYNEDFYTKGRWAGVKADCADAVYFSRIIFSYLNSLPFQINDYTKKSKYITNDMNNWDHLPEGDERVRAMMKWLLGVVGTGTLASDTYPIAINRETVTRGKVWVRPSMHKTFFNNIFDLFKGKINDPNPGHSEVVKDVTPAGIVYLIGSTTPADGRTMTITTSYKMLPVNQRLGLRAWKQPQHYELPLSKLPGYSLEQYSMGFPPKELSETFSAGDGQAGVTKSRNAPDWEAQVIAKLASRAETKEEVMDRLAKEACSMAYSRAEVVLESENYRLGLKGRCMSDDAFEGYSTPSRDKRIYETLEELGKLGGEGMFMSDRMKSPVVAGLLKKCPDLQIAPNKTISMLDYAINVAKDRVSSDPNTVLESRWGISTDSASCR